MRRIRIGLIDSGPGPDANPPLHAFRDFTGAAETADLLGHGTAIASILSAAHPAVELVVARIFEQRPVCPVLRVARALDWLREQQVDIVNMSFGLREDREVLRAACERAAHSGILLVAAAPARGAPVYPAALGCVIKATGDARCSPQEVSLLRSAQADFGGCVRHPGTGSSGASIGCASVTGRFAAAMAEHGDEWFQHFCRREVRYRGIERRVAALS